MTTSISEPEFVLKTTPPRIHRAALRRERLSGRWTDLRERTAIEVVAPSGFGKTTLLLHWRRLWLEQGALVAWLSIDARDEPARFNLALLHAVRNAAGRSRFDVLADRCTAQYDDMRDDNALLGGSTDGLTSLLAEIALLGIETVLMIDEAERLPQSTIRESLVYLLHNAPPNLHVVLGSRVPLQLPTAELEAKGNFACLRTEELRLQIEESTAILQKRFGKQLGVDDCVRLHEATEGWPIGLQLAAATIEHAPNLAAAVRTLSARRGQIERYFVESLLSRLPEPVAAFLARIAILEHLHVELCEAVTQCPSATAYLAQLMLETLIMVVGRSKDWSHLHPLARDFLLSRFEQFNADEQSALHRRASQWFAERQHFHAAARHALAAGDATIAHAHAARSLWILGTDGRIPEAREWLARIPAETIAKDHDLRLIAAWILALSDRNEEALRRAQELVADPSAEPRTQFVAALVAASASGFADRLGSIPGILARWPEGSALIESSGHPAAYAVCLALIALHEGRTERVRQLEPRSPASAYKYSPVLGRSIGRTLVGISYLWDGNPGRAEAIVRPAMLKAEQVAGRRGAVACMFATVVAAALLERNQPFAAQTLLAGRLDVIESTAIPDAILSAYRTLAYVALAQGDEPHALRILDNLRALAVKRKMPRLAMHALAEQIRIHALQSRNETVGALELALDAIGADFEREEFRPFHMQYDLVAAIAKTYAALGRDDPDSAERHALVADALATRLQRGRDGLVIKVLRAVIARQRHAAHALPLLAEAIGLARIGGNLRLLADSHPMATAMALELRVHDDARVPAASIEDDDAATEQARSANPGALLRSGLLTPKEAEILGLLNNHMPNKLIARAMEISDETVKWHLKNLFSKLSAGTRKHAVDRARLLGLIGS